MSSIGQEASIGERLKAMPVSKAKELRDADWLAKDLTREFFILLDAHDVEGIAQLFNPDARFDIAAAGISGRAGEAGVKFLQKLIKAFPDLRVFVRSLMGNDGVSVAEVTIEGTQAADFMGVHNQEKFLDHDQAWVFRVEHNRISEVRAYWCQNALYRRLAVKRLDQISITG